MTSQPTAQLLLTVLLLFRATTHLPTTAQADDKPLIESISKETLWSNRDGKSRTWFHPRACMLPGPDGRPIALMNLQEIGGSDYFGQVHWSTSDDLGRTWSEPQPIAALGRDQIPGPADDLRAAVCDVTPQYHPQTETVIALGHVVFYKGAYFARKEQLARYPVYVTRSKDGTWSPRRILEWGDPRGAHIYSNNYGQRVILPGGDVQMSFTFGPKAERRRGVDVHPHKGFETVTILYQGELAHRDSSGGSGHLSPGDVQWMTAGSGIVHEEFHSDRFTSDGGVLEMAQLWVNLPASDKSTPPKYQDLRDEQFPRVKLADDTGEVRVIAGDFDGTRGPASTFTPINVWDVRVYAGRTAQLTVPAGHTCVLIVQLGTLTANNSPVKSMEVVQFERDGSLIELKTETASRVLLLSGKPLEEPVVGQGPFVMNTRQEIQ